MRITAVGAHLAEITTELLEPGLPRRGRLRDRRSRLLVVHAARQ